MPISDSQKIDYIWKKVGYGLAKTDTNSNKYAVNESIVSPLLTRADRIWTNSNEIPGVKPASSTAYVGLEIVECTADTTATTNRTWLTNKTDWIGAEFGSTYLVEVFIHDSGDAAGADAFANKVFVTGSGNNDEWFFDYQAGVLNFIGDNLPNGRSFTGKSVYVKGARYIGEFGIGVSLADIDNHDIFSFSVGADDSTLRTIGTNESFKIIGGTNVTTTSDAEGNITINATGGGSSITNVSELINDAGYITAADTFSLNITGDDSTVVSVTSGETIQLIGGTNISTATDVDGNITITNDFAQDFQFSSLTGTPTTISGYGITDAFSGDYNDLTNLPTLFSGAYNDLTGKPTLFSGDYNDLTNLPTLFSGAYADLTGKPSFATVATSGDYDDLTNKPDLSGYLTSETTTTLVDNGDNTFTYTNELGTATTIDLSVYLDDSNLARLTSGTVDANGIATFTRDDATTFTVDFSNLNNQYSFSVAADDSTQRTISSGETIQFTGATGITTATDAEGNVTITGTAQDFQFSSLTGTPTTISGYGITDAFDGDYNSLTNRPTLFSGNYNDLTNRPIIPTVPTNVSEFANDAGYLTSVDQFNFSVGADDSTQREISDGESIRFIGGTNISTTSDAEGNITITNDFTQDFAYSSLTGAPTIPSATSDLTNDSGFITAADIPDRFGFAVAGDDSTQRIISTNEIIKFIGGTNISTATDSEGNITITNDFVQDFAYSSLTGAPTIPTVPTNVSEFTNDAGYITSYDQYKFSVGADDSTLREVSNDESIRFIGGTNISTTSDSEGNITITNDFTQDFAYSSLTGTPTIPANISDLNNDYGYITAADLPVNVSELTNDAGYITESSVTLTSDDSTSVLGNSFSIEGGTGGLISTTTNPAGGVFVDLNPLDVILTDGGGSISNGDLNITTNNSISFGPSVNPLSEIQWQGTITQFTSPSNTIRINAGNTGRVELAQSTSVKLHTTTDGVVVTGTLNTHTIPGGSGTLALTSDIPTATSDLTNDSGFITVDDIPPSATDYTFSVGADDSTLRTIDNGESIKFAGGARITTESNAEGDITITGEVPAHISQTPPANPEEGELWWESDSGKQYVYYDGYWVESTNQGTPSFSVDYSDVANTPTIPSATSDLTNDSNFITLTNLSVAIAGVPSGNGSLAYSQGTGQFTFTPADVPVDLADLDNVSDASPGVGQVLAWGGSQWEPQDQTGAAGGGGTGDFSLSVGADDSTLRTVNSGESIKFIGGTNISTTSDAEGNITINNDGTSLTISESAPSSPNEGELWWESDSGRMYVYYDSYWVQTNNPNDVASLEGFTSTAKLQEITAASTSFADFQARIANL